MNDGGTYDSHLTHYLQFISFSNSLGANEDIRVLQDLHHVDDHNVSAVIM